MRCQFDLLPSALAPSLVFGGALTIYAATLAPTVTLVDSGELLFAAHSVGVAHPPGFPLYLLLAKAAAYLPVGSVATRVHMVSALSASLAAASVALLVACLAPASSFWARTGSGLLFAGSRTLWAYATIAEVYALNIALVAVVLLLLIQWRRKQDSRWFSGAALLLGLSLGVHHLTVALALPSLTVLALDAARKSKATVHLAVRGVLLALGAGAAVYTYLPLAARAAPLWNWGDPSNWQRFWRHITGYQYQTFFSFAPQTISRQVEEFVSLTFRQFGPWWLPLGLLLVALGFWHFWCKDRAAFWCLTLLAAVNVLGTAGYEIAEDKDAYHLPAFLSLAVAAGVGMHALSTLVKARRLPARALGAILLLSPCVSLAANYRASNRSNYFLAADYAQNILEPVPAGGLLLTGDWQVYAPLLYAQWIEGIGRGAVVVDVNLLRRSWYFDNLERQYPEVFQQTRPAVNAFLEDLRAWEQEPGTYERDPTLSVRIASRFGAVVLGLISGHLKSGVYVTQDVVLDQIGDFRSLAASLRNTYRLVPQGLVFQVSDQVPQAPRVFRLRMRGLQEFVPHLQADDVALTKVLPVYVAMLRSRAEYLQGIGQSANAEEASRLSATLQRLLHAARPLCSFESTCVSRE